MPEEPDARPPSPHVDVAYELTTRLTKLEAKLDAHPTSAWARIGAIAGALALALSIGNASYTLYDQLVHKPDEEKAQEYSAFQSDIRSIVSAQEDLAKSSTQGGVSELVEIQSANHKIQSIMQDVTRLLRLLGPSAAQKDGKYFVGSWDYIILGGASFQGGNVETALQYVNDAVGAADNLHAQSEALRNKAIMLFQARGASGVAAAENALEAALNNFSQITNNGMPNISIDFDRAALFATKSSIEANAGKCNDAADAATKMISLVSSEDMIASRSFIASMFIGGVQWQQRCPLSTFPGSVRAFVDSAAPRPPATAPPLASGVNAASQLRSNAAATLTNSSILASPKLSLDCRFENGPRAGQTQSYAGVPGVQPVPVGTPCYDGQGSSGRAE